MITIATRPTNMDHRGDVYYPAGLPTESSPETWHWHEYRDSDLRTFWIRYTRKQVEEEVKKWGFFSPFYPLLQSYHNYREQNRLTRSTQ
jgi:hypothetical protein